MSSFRTLESKERAFDTVVQTAHYEDALPSPKLADDDDDFIRSPWIGALASDRQHSPVVSGTDHEASEAAFPPKAVSASYFSNEYSLMGTILLVAVVAGVIMGVFKKPHLHTPNKESSSSIKEQKEELCLPLLGDEEAIV